MTDSIFEHSNHYKPGCGPLYTIHTVCGKQDDLPFDTLIKLHDHEWQWVGLLKPGDRVQLTNWTNADVKQVVLKEETDRTAVSKHPELPSLNQGVVTMQKQDEIVKIFGKMLTTGAKLVQLADRIRTKREELSNDELSNIIYNELGALMDFLKYLNERVETEIDNITSDEDSQH